MPDPSGGSNTGPVLEGVGALLTSMAAVGALIVSLFRRPAASDRGDDDLKDAVADFREQVLEAHDLDYRREVRRVHQLEALCKQHGIPVPDRLDDE